MHRQNQFSGKVMTIEKRFTVAIIGGGVAGISAANYFAKKKY